MSPSAKKRPENGVVFEVGLRTGPRGGLTKSNQGRWRERER